MGLKSVLVQGVIDQQKSNMDQVDHGRGGDGVCVVFISFNETQCVHQMLV